MVADTAAQGCSRSVGTAAQETANNTVNQQEQHQEWKAKYGKYIQTKTIFDYE